MSFVGASPPRLCVFSLWWLASRLPGLRQNVSVCRDACGSVMTFLVRLLEMELPGSGSSGDRAVYTALLPRAPAMVRLLLAGAAGALPPARNPQIAGVLFALIKVTPATLPAGVCPVRALYQRQDSDLQLRLPTNVRVPRHTQVTQQQGLQWASQAVAAVPETALSASDRQKLLGVMQVTAIEGPEARNYGWVCCRNRHPHPALHVFKLPVRCVWVSHDLSWDYALS